MPCTVKVNGPMLSVVHKGSTGMAPATIPDVCKTPSPAGPVPIPYPNFTMSSTLAKGTTTVKTDGMMAAIKGSEFSLSQGDNPGVAGGVKSSTFMKESTWITHSSDVKMEGKNVCRFTDKKFNNHENCATLCGEIQGPVVPIDFAKVGWEQEDACAKFNATKVDDHDQAAQDAGMRRDDYEAMKKFSKEKDVTVSFRATNKDSAQYIGKVPCKPLSCQDGTQKTGEYAGLVLTGKPGKPPPRFTGDYDMHDLISNKPPAGTVRNSRDQAKLISGMNGKMADGRNFPRVMHGPQSTLGDYLKQNPGKLQGEHAARYKSYLKPMASAKEPVTVFDNGRVYQLKSNEDVVNMYRCKGVDPPPEWNMADKRSQQKLY